MRLFVFGAGYSGKAIAHRLRSKAEWIGGTTRSPDKFAQLSATGVTPFTFEGTDLPQNADLAETTHLIVSIAPGEDSDPVLRAFPDLSRRMAALRWIGYLSTVGVYGDHGGAWVDEESECRPASRRSVRRLAAEDEWLGLGRRAGLPVAVLRLSGIYGPGRNAFVNLQSGTAKRILKPGQVFNRIHVEDIAGATAMLAVAETDGVFNVTDNEPAPPQDVVAYAARLMGVEPPLVVAFEAAELSPMARSFYGENKRVANAKIKAAGYRFEHPHYRAGLDALWRSGAWRQD